MTDISGSKALKESSGDATLFEKLKASEAARAEAQAFQKATSEILSVISGSPTDVQPVFNMIVERAVELCGAAFGFVLRYDGQVINVAAHHNLDAEGLRVLQTFWPMAPKPESLVGRAILGCRVVHVHDILTERAYPYSSLQQALGYRTIVVVPFYRQQEAIGAIAIYRQEVAPFSETQIALVQTFANQAVIAIENVRMFNEIREKSRQVEEQAEQLADWNRTLETRVAEQVDQIGRMSKLTRFLSPKISEVIMSGEADDPLKTRRAEITVVYVDLRVYGIYRNRRPRGGHECAARVPYRTWTGDYCI
jgi:transcriptional regulator with GAF, ATPase, and Fis domain